MDAFDRAWTAITSTRLRMALTAGIVVLAIGFGVGIAAAMGLLRDAGATVADASPSATNAIPTDRAAPSERATTEPANEATTKPSVDPTVTPTPVASPSPTPAATPSPTIPPTPAASGTPTTTPQPTPAPARAVGDGWPTGMRAMTIVEGLTLLSQPAGGTPVGPALARFTELTIAGSAAAPSGERWYRVADLDVTLAGGATSGWLPESDAAGHPRLLPSAAGCGALLAEGGDIAIDSYAELVDGFVGTWGGCAFTPWIAPYPVLVTFRADGTYSGRAVTPDAAHEPAFYYGTDVDSPLKRYWLSDLHDDLRGSGAIDIVFSADSVNRGGLRNIALMGAERELLEFEFFHRDTYGPLVYRLHRLGGESGWSSS